MNDYIQSLLSQGGFVYIIDVGGSYAKSCEMLNGQLIDFNHDTEISLNLFSTIDAQAKNDTAFKDVHNQINPARWYDGKDHPVTSVMKNEVILRKPLRRCGDNITMITTITLIAHHLEEQYDPVLKILGGCCIAILKTVVMAIILSRLVRWILKEI